MIKNKQDIEDVKKVTVDNLNIVYQESGNENIQTLLLLHGWGQSHSFWKDIINRYASQYHIYALDLPGFGLSQEPPTTWSLQEYANFIHKFNALHISTPIVIGHSFGGRIAAIYASQYPTKKLVLYSNGGLHQKSLKHTLYKYVFVNFTRHIIPNYIYVSHTRIFKPKNYYNKIFVNTARSKRVLDIYSQPSPNLKQFLEKIKTDTLIVSGKRDYIVEPSMGKRLHEIIRNSELLEVPNATHFAHIETPQI